MSRRAKGSRQKGGTPPASSRTAQRSPPPERANLRPYSLPELKDWHAIAILGAAIAIFFREILLQQAFFWEDWITQVYPFRTFAAVSLAEGEIPLWNPFIHSGMPFQADIQSALFYIPNLLLTFFVRDGTLDFYWIEVLVIAHYWLAGVTMYYLAREFQLERAYALFSGLVFALSGFMIVRVIHPAFIEQIAWLPLIVLLLHRTIIRQSPQYAILCGLVTGHSILAGAPQISLFVFVFLSLFSLFVVFAAKHYSSWRDRVSRLWLVVLMVAVAVGLAAVQLLPTLELAPLSQRAALTFEESQHYSLAWAQLITVLVPKFFGVSGAHESSFWLSGIYGVFWEACFYWGIAALLAAALSLIVARKNRYLVFLLAVIVLSLMLAVGDNLVLHRIFFDLIPGFDKFRGVQRIMVLAGLAMALLSGFGLRAFIELSTAKPRKLEMYMLGAVMLLFVLWVLVQQGLFLPKGEAGYERIRSLALRETSLALLMTMALCGMGFLLTRAIVKPAVFIAGLLVFQYSDVSIFGFEQNNGAVSIEAFYREARTVIPRLKEAQSGSPFRVTIRKGNALLWDQNQGMVDRIPVTEGYTALALKRKLPPARDWDATYDLLNSRYRIVADSQQQKVSAASVRAGVPRAFAAVRTEVPRAFVVHDVEILAGDSLVATFMLRQGFNPRRTVVLEEQPSIIPEADSGATSGDAFVVSSDLNSIKLKVDTRRNGILVLSEIYYPGWNAYVDGKRQQVLRADWSLRAVPIAAGAHDVEMRFEPTPFRTGALITGATLLLCCSALVWPRLRKGKMRFSGFHLLS